MQASAQILMALADIRERELRARAARAWSAVTPPAEPAHRPSGAPAGASVGVRRVECAEAGC